MGNIICVKILPRLYADNVTIIKISNKLTPSIDYFLNFIQEYMQLVFLAVTVFHVKFYTNEDFKVCAVEQLFLILTISAMEGKF